jgi:hypothetical protein
MLTRMTKTTAVSPPVSEILEQFFDGFEADASDARRLRNSAVRLDLEQYLEREGERILTDGQRAILNTERDFDREGAFVRTMHAPDLFYALEHYLDPAHAFLGIEQRRVQVEAIAALITCLLGGRWVWGEAISECCLIDVELAIRRARTDLSHARAFERSLRRP